MTRKRQILLAASAIVLIAGAIAAWNAVSAWRVDSAVRQLKSSDPSTREAAITRLASLRDERDLRRLVWHLGDEDEGVRKGVVEALARIGAPAVVPSIAFARSALKAPFYFDTAAYQKLCQWLPWLKVRTKAPCMFVIIIRTEYMGATGQAGMAGGGREVPARVADANEALLALFPRLGGGVVEPLISMAGDKSKYARLLAIKCLAQIGDPRAYDVLERAARARDSWQPGLEGIGNIEAHRAAALGNPGLDAVLREAWRLYDRKREGAIDTLIAGLGNSNWIVRIPAVRALGACSHEPRVFERLAGVVRDPKENGYVRAEGLKAAGASGDARLPGLVEEGLSDADAAGAAVAVLCRFDRDQQLDILTRNLAIASPSDRSVRLQCFYFIHDETMVPALVERCRTGSPAERLDARRALERIAGTAITIGDDSQEVMDAKNRINQAAKDATAAMTVQDAQQEGEK